jgi:hypothetical protein
MAERNMDEIKSSLLKVIADHLDSLEREGSLVAARPRSGDLYSRNDPGDLYSRTS